MFRQSSRYHRKTCIGPGFKCKLSGERVPCHTRLHMNKTKASFKTRRPRYVTNYEKKLRVCRRKRKNKLKSKNVKHQALAPIRSVNNVPKDNDSASRRQSALKLSGLNFQQHGRPDMTDVAASGWRHWCQGCCRFCANKSNCNPIYNLLPEHNATKTNSW